MSERVAGINGQEGQLVEDNLIPTSTPRACAAGLTVDRSVERNRRTPLQRAIETNIKQRQAGTE